MDIANYKKRKVEKTCELTRVGPGEFLLVARAWDPESGKEVASARISCIQQKVEETRQAAENTIRYHQQVVQSCNELLADMIAAEKQAVKKSRA